MKKVWIKVDPWSKEKVLAALEGGADAVLLLRETGGRHLGQLVEERIEES